MGKERKGKGKGKRKGREKEVKGKRRGERIKGREGKDEAGIGRNFVQL